MACNNIKEASQFYILATDNKGHPYEFYIAYYDNISPTSHSSDGTNPTALGPIARYLQAPCSMRGTNQGPLSVCHHGAQNNCRFAIHNRLVSGNAVPLALPSWTSGRDIFFINCLGRKRRKDGYLCVRQSQGSKYVTSCVSGTSAHNGYSIFMLFRLLPGSYRTKGFPGTDADIVQSTEVLQIDTPRNRGASNTHDKEEERHRDTARLLKTDLSSHSTAQVPMLEMHESNM